jgi:allophanate hydrolase
MTVAVEQKEPPMRLETLAFTLPALRAAYAGGLSPRAVIVEALARLERLGDPGIFLHMADRAALLAEAEALGVFDPDRPLWGIPFAVKDNIDVAGMPTTAACPAWSYRPDRDAFAVARLRAAGAIPIGKTNLDQFATGLVGTRTPHPVPRNALDPAIVPGGSSSGSAVAVAQGIVPFSLGTDTAGSGRVPAALNGIAGLKPTLGAVSASGVVPACRTLDTISVFARDVADAWRVFEVLARYDAADAYARPVRVPPLPAPLPAPRIGVPDTAGLRFFGDTLQAASFAATLEALRDLGAEIVELDFAPFHAVAAMLYEGAWVAERHSVIEELLGREPEAVHPVTRAIIGKADGLSATDAFRGIYRLAELRRACAPLIASVDMIAVPSIPTFYTLADLAADPVTPNSNLGTYTNFVNLLDLCALTLPVAPRADGRPGSLTLIGPAGTDAQLAAEALRLTAEMTGAAAPLAAGPSADEIALAVCGAHMSGLPLNGQLTALGGRFLRVARTTPAYRLHALAGGPPRRPGLVRVAEDGAQIALEVWALPRAAVGELLVQIPAPLGLGSVALEDGSAVAGFLCEAAGLVGATDITAQGGWRAWLAAQAA